MATRPSYPGPHSFRSYTAHVDKSAGLGSTELFACPDLVVELLDVILVVTEAFATNAGGDLSVGIATDTDKFIRSLNIPVTAVVGDVFSIYGTKADAQHDWVSTTAYDTLTGNVLLKKGERLVVAADATAGTGEYTVHVQYRIHSEREA